MARLVASFRVGALEVTQLSDGSFHRPLGGFFDGVDPAEWMPLAGVASPEEGAPFNFSAMLVRGDGHTTLIDTANGTRAVEDSWEGGAQLFARLAEVGVEPGDVDTVVYSHLHPDHIGWNLTPEGRPAFPNARFHLSEPELDWWLHYDGNDHPMRDYAREKMGPLVEAGQVESFVGDRQVTPSLTMVYAPGHTPGHCVQLLESEGEAALIVGDSAHHPVHLARQGWHSTFDWNRDQARAARRKLAEIALHKEAIVTGVHFPILTLGRMERDGAGGYRYVVTEGPGGEAESAP